MHTEPAPGWEREIPKYRVTRDIQPAQRARYRSEPPFAHCFDSDVWQYGERTLKAGETVETKAWPHPTFFPLNYSAKRTLDFFNFQMKSRLPRSPWHGDSLRLDNGLTGNTVTVDDAAMPRLEPISLKPIA
jgi:hypothetical protein